MVLPDSSRDGLTDLYAGAVAWQKIAEHLKSGDDLSTAVSAANTFINANGHINTYIIIGNIGGVGVKIR